MSQNWDLPKEDINIRNFYFDLIPALWKEKKSTAAALLALSLLSYGLLPKSLDSVPRWVLILPAPLYCFGLFYRRSTQMRIWQVQADNYNNDRASEATKLFIFNSLGESKEESLSFLSQLRASSTPQTLLNNRSKKYPQLRSIDVKRILENHPAKA